MPINIALLEKTILGLKTVTEIRQIVDVPEVVNNIAEQLLIVYNELKELNPDPRNFKDYPFLKLIYKLESALGKTVNGKAKKIFPPEILGNFKSPIFSPTHTAITLVNQSLDILNPLVQLFMRLEPIQSPHSLRLNKALVKSINNISGLLIELSNNETLFQFIRHKAPTAAERDYIRTICESNSFITFIKANGAKDIINTVQGVANILRRFQEYTEIGGDVPSLQIITAGTSFRAMKRLVPGMTLAFPLFLQARGMHFLANPIGLMANYSNKYFLTPPIALLQQIHESNLLKYPVFALELGSQLMNIASIVHSVRNLSSITNLPNQLIKASSFLKSSPWPDESKELRMQLYFALENELINKRHIDEIIKNVFYNALIKASEQTGAKIGEALCSLLYLLHKGWPKGDDIYGYYPQAMQAITGLDKPNEAFSFFINRFFWNSYLVPLAGFLGAGFATHLGRVLTKSQITNSSEKIRDNIRYQLSLMLLNPQEILAMRIIETRPNGRDQIVANSPDIIKTAAYIAGLFASHLEKNRNIEDLTQIKFSDIFLRPMQILRAPRRPYDDLLPHGNNINTLIKTNLPSNCQYQPSWAELAHYSNPFSLAAIAIFGLILWEMKAPQELIWPIAVLFALSTINNALEHNKIWPYAEIRKSPISMGHNTDIDTAERYSNEFDRYSSQISTATNEAGLPPEAELIDFIARLNDWLNQKTTDTKSIQLRSVVSQLEIDRIIIKRQEKIGEFCHALTGYLHTYVKDHYSKHTSHQNLIKRIDATFLATNSKLKSDYPTISTYFKNYFFHLSELNKADFEAQVVNAALPEPLTPNLKREIVELYNNNYKSMHLNNILYEYKELIDHRLTTPGINEKFIKFPILSTYLNDQQFIEAFRAIINERVKATTSRTWHSSFFHTNYLEDKTYLLAKIAELPENFTDTKVELAAFVEKGFKSVIAPAIAEPSASSASLMSVLR